MAIKHPVRDWAQGLNDEGPDGDVGYEPTIHNIDVHPVGTGTINGLDLNGGKEPSHAHAANLCQSTAFTDLRAKSGKVG